MKARMHFDTLTYANKLKAAGMDPKLAEVHALALVEAREDGVATKMDLAEVKSELKADIAELKAELKSEFRTELTAVKSELIKWMISLFITNLTLVGAFIALSQFLNHPR